MDFSQQPFLLHLAFAPRHCGQESVSDLRVSRSDLGSSIRQGHLNSFVESQLSNLQTGRKYRDKLCNLTEDTCTVGGWHLSFTNLPPFSLEQLIFLIWTAISLIGKWQCIALSTHEEKKTSKALKLKVLPWSRHWRTGPSLLPEICQGAVFNSNCTQSSGSLSPLSIRQSICSQSKIPLHPFRGQHIRMMLSSAVWSQHESRLLALPSPAIPLLLRIDTEKLLKT